MSKRKENINTKCKKQKGSKEWENLCREIGIMRQLDHPNVIKMHTIFQSPGQYHIVLD